VDFQIAATRQIRLQTANICHGEYKARTQAEGGSRMGTPEAQSLPPEIQQELRERWKGLRLAGILAIIVGLVAIAVPAVFAVGTSIFIGIILLFAGSWMLFDAWSVRGAGRVAIRVFWALLTEVAGLYLLLAPLSGTVTLTFVLVVYFIVIGSVRIGEAIALRQMPNAGWVGLNGALSLLIGLLIGLDFPSSADWAIGLLVGIDLIFAGWGLLGVSGLGKRLAAT
jgi:uncharacterized membrane protein HdeD (DUF308 family)